MTCQVRFTTMASAMNAAFKQCQAEGRNPGRVGHRVLTNNARGVGQIIVQRDKKKKEESKAESADKKLVEVCEAIEGKAYVDGKGVMIDRQPIIKTKKRKVVLHA